MAIDTAQKRRGAAGVPASPGAANVTAAAKRRMADAVYAFDAGVAAGGGSPGAPSPRRRRWLGAEHRGPTKRGR